LDLRELNVGADVLRQAFRARPSVIFVTTHSGVILEATSAAAAFLNMPLDRLLGKPLLHFIARRDTRRFRGFVKNGAGESIGVDLRPRGGRPHAMVMTVQPAPQRLIWTARAVAVREEAAAVGPTRRCA
jgi:PAS domain-containing protein